MGWRWWLRIGINETPRMRPSWWYWMAVRSEFLAGLRRFTILIGANVTPAIRAFAAAAEATARAAERFGVVLASEVREPLETQE